MEKEFGNIHIILTTFCNMGCSGCYQEHLTEHNNLILNDQTKENIKKVYNQFKSENLDIKVSFFGGEPLLRSETIIDILWFLKESDMDIKYINLPTSGGKDLNLFKKVLPEINRIVKLTFPKAKFTTSLSYDGPDNLKLRNVSPVLIEEGFSFLINNNIEPMYTSCVIPISSNDELNGFNGLDRHYFINTYMDVVRRTGLAPTFTIPHIIHHTPDYIDLAIGLGYLLDYLEISFEHQPFSNEIIVKTGRFKDSNMIPKLIRDVIDKLTKPILANLNYNWCQAGTKHLTITKDYIMDCEFLSKPAQYSIEALINWCSNCSIKDLCQKPCLKNVELIGNDFNEPKLKRQCDFRKVLVHTIQQHLLKNIENQKFIKKD